MRIIIRADGNSQIAMGHMMRCLSIGEALRRQGAEVLFVTAGAETAELIAKHGFAHQILGSDFRKMEEELPLLKKLLLAYPAELLLADSYFVTEAYFKALGSFVKTVYLDDLGKIYPVDGLLNYNIYGNELPYESLYAKAHWHCPRLLLGCSYAPLREEFTKGKCSRVREQVRDVLITTGGGDLLNAAGRLCSRLAKERKAGLHQGINYHVVCGPFFTEKEALHRLAAQQEGFVIHENVTHMSELMEDCDIAVSAAGSTMYELCSMRLPAVCFYFAENQRQMAECFDRTTEISCAGDLRADGEGTLERLTDRLLMLEQDGALRGKIRRQMAGLTDGQGAQRIAGQLLAL